MPQLNIFTYLSQTTWTIIIFTCFFYIMKQELIPSLYEVFYVRNNSFTNTNTESVSKIKNKKTYNFII